MEITLNKRRKIPLYLAYFIALLALFSLLLLSRATEGSQKFEQFYKPLIISVVLGIIFLISIVVVYLIKLVKNYRKDIPGTSLSITILWRSLFLAFIPLFFISYFSFKFLRYEFQSSFDEGINDALNNALVLSKKALDIRAVQALDDSRTVADKIGLYGYSRLQTDLEKIRNRANAYELTVLDEKGFIQAFSSADLTTFLPFVPSHNDFVRVENEGGIFVIESDTAKFQIRTLVAVNKPGSLNYYLQTVFHIPDTVSDLTAQVNRTITERDRFNYLMPRVNKSFIFVLILVVLLASLILILSSISFANDMAKPIRLLIQGTKRVSRGDFNELIIVQRNNDFGTLMQSFNRMTRSLQTATEEIEYNRDRIESERAYLETVMNHMTACVITLDYEYRLQTFNERAENILKVQLSEAMHCNLEALDLALDSAKQFIIETMESYAKGKQNEIEVTTLIQGNSTNLIVNVTPLPSTDNSHGGYVIIFEVLGEYLQQQKQAAWEEVARRLAHEIKNPLTPIQLAAERLNYKLSGDLDEKQKQVLSRSVEIITNQVKSLKDMVNDFSNFAKPSITQKETFNFSPLLREVFDLYRGHYEKTEFTIDIFVENDTIEGNPQKLRQVLHNIIKNAIEACESRIDKKEDISIGEINIQLISKEKYLTLTVTDNGIGLSNSGSQLFEPYVTTKEKGTGLGLAIVKKIIQEHQGTIELHAKNTDAGTVAIVNLPLIQPIGIKINHESTAI